MLPATFLKLALFAFAAVSPGLARSHHSDSAGDDNNIDVQARDDVEPMHVRAFGAGYLYGREFADESISARALDEAMEGLEGRGWSSNYPPQHASGRPADFDFIIYRDVQER